jgi:hypothetical protein
MIGTKKVSLTKINFITTFEPFKTCLLEFFHGENRNLHTFFKVISLFYHVENIKGSNSLLGAGKSKKKPNVISISVDVILYHQKVLVFIRKKSGCICTAQITALKVSVYFVIFDV